jgi:hypothetical protein
MEIQNWLTYFESNMKNGLSISKDVHTLTDEERKRITGSIQSFQLGESSEGNVLREQARAQSIKTGEPGYLEAIEHLIREENLHSAYLGQFMQQHSIPKIKRGWNDACFRFLRRLAGVELSTRILVTAEVIALTYYECLGGATQSAVLKEICSRMCEEEKAHIKFQMFQIHRINFQKHTLFGSLSNILHFVLTFVTLFPVWLGHKEVLRTKYDFRTYVKKVWSDFQNSTYQGQLNAARSLVRTGFLSPEVLCS